MRDKIKLVSSAGTGHYYTTTKNKRTTPDKMEIHPELKSRVNKAHPLFREFIKAANRYNKYRG